MTFSICTLGCKVNQYESAVIRDAFEKAGYVFAPFDGICDVYCINTCAVTERSARKSRQMVRRARTLNPDAVVAVAGCLTQTSPETAEMAEADVVVGSAEKARLPEYVAEFIKTHRRINAVRDISSECVFESMSAESGGRTRAAVKIQDGCNNFCSYCIIPYARGRIRSKPEAETVEQIRSLVCDGGYREIVLTGIHLDNYGKDTSDTDLCTLLEKIDAIPGLERVRLGSLEPVFVTEENVKRLAALKTLCPHFHLSLQSGCAETLRRMNRHYTPQEFSEAAARLRKYIPDVSITTDVIVGFPGETEKEFAESLSFAASVGFLKINVFPYSERRGTAAAAMPDKIRTEVKEVRCAEMEKVSLASAKKFISGYRGKTLRVLFERGKNGVYAGYTPNYTEIRVRSPQVLTNTVRNVEIAQVFGYFASGDLK